jgi:hypothetical protein
MKEKIERAKAHLRENKKVYIAGGTGLVVGAAGVLLFGTEQIVIVDAIKVQLGWKSPTTNNITTLLVRRGHPGYVVRCNETGELFASQNRAASMMGINPSAISQQLSGKYEKANGYTFTKLGEAQTA